MSARGGIGGPCLAVLVALAAVVGTAHGQAAESTCVTCHRAPDTGQAKLVDAWKDSVHAAAGVSCHDCHGGDPTQEAIERAMDPAAGYKETIRKADVPALCASCHADAERMKKYGLRVDQYALYLTSEHGRALAQGDTSVAVCTTCHRAHDVYKATSPKSPSARRNVPALCASCHADAAKMAPYKIPTDQYDQYVKSYHGRLLLEQNDTRAPTCASCHGNHGAEFPDVASLVEVCHTCHAVTADYFKKSPHYESSRKDGVPLCIHCHGDHDVSFPDGSLLVGSDERHCGQCHDAGSKALALAGQIHGQLAEAEGKIAAAEERLRKAEGYGMDPLEAREALDRARSALIETLPVVHTLDLGTLDGYFKKVGAEADAASQEAGMLLSDYARRRQGLGVLTVAFVVVMGLLAVKLALVMRHHESGTAPPRDPPA